jgi:divalent metal cation (Fe/Co/Zn/Cd) transporter
MNFFQISTSSVSDLLGYTTTLFSNVLPVLLPFLALIIGFWIFGALSRFGHSLTDSAWNYEEDPSLTEADKKYYRKTRPRSVYQEEEEDEDEDEDL